MKEYDGDRFSSHGAFDTFIFAFQGTGRGVTAQEVSWIRGQFDMLDRDISNQVVLESVLNYEPGIPSHSTLHSISGSLECIPIWVPRILPLDRL